VCCGSVVRNTHTQLQQIPEELSRHARSLDSRGTAFPQLPSATGRLQQPRETQRGVGISPQGRPALQRALLGRQARRQDAIITRARAHQGFFTGEDRWVDRRIFVAE
ncbi:unnamed protein product, partial [Ectocarpus sp. 12 AP-2014]